MRVGVFFVEDRCGWRRRGRAALQGRVKSTPCNVALATGGLR